MDQRQARQVIGILHGAMFLDQARTADGHHRHVGKLVDFQRRVLLAVGTHVAHGDIDAVGLEVGVIQRRRNPQVDIGEVVPKR